ncbi:hypothetical protein [Allocoleopsis sp.]|uniref:hypothetical protein n=1 Tax=Allocoleopsis sp. TaxID=3088169 RepID=UPI002FD54225
MKRAIAQGAPAKLIALRPTVLPNCNGFFITHAIALRPAVVLQRLTAGTVSD